MSNLLDNKKKLREELRRRRDAFFGQLDPATRNLAFRRPPSPLAALIADRNVIAAYASVGSEAPTARLIEYIQEQQKTVAFPIVTGSNPLEFREVSDIELLETGYRGIPEPGAQLDIVKPDLILCPMTGFDRSLNRLGQGGGHYDRTFEKHPEAIRVGLAWSVQEVDEIPVGPHDIDLHMVVTECEIIQRDSLTS